MSCDARLFDQVAAGDAEVDGAFGAQDGNVVGAEERDVDRHVADAGEQAALLAAEAEAGFDQQLGGEFGEAALARNADAEVHGRRMQDSGVGMQGILQPRFAAGFL